MTLKNYNLTIYQELIEGMPIIRDRLFNKCMIDFRNALKETEIILPKNQAIHALQYTFDRHCMMNGVNILVLKEILGHSSIT